MERPTRKNSPFCATEAQASTRTWPPATKQKPLSLQQNLNQNYEISSMQLGPVNGASGHLFFPAFADLRSFLQEKRGVALAL
jgi:hypothetical protein